MINLPKSGGVEFLGGYPPKWGMLKIQQSIKYGVNVEVNKKVRVQIEGVREVSREVEDYNISMDMAKHICMIQRTPEGMRCSRNGWKRPP